MEELLEWMILSCTLRDVPEGGAGERRGDLRHKALSRDLRLHPPWKTHGMVDAPRLNVAKMHVREKGWVWCPKNHGYTLSMLNALIKAKYKTHKSCG